MNASLGPSDRRSRAGLIESATHLSWRSSSGVRTPSAWLSWLQSHKSAPLRHTTFKKRSKRFMESSLWSISFVIIKNRSKWDQECARTFSTGTFSMQNAQNKLSWWFIIHVSHLVDESNEKCAFCFLNDAIDWILCVIVQFIESCQRCYKSVNGPRWNGEYFQISFGITNSASNSSLIETIYLLAILQKSLDWLISS